VASFALVFLDSTAILTVGFTELKVVRDPRLDFKTLLPIDLLVQHVYATNNAHLSG
jgi:hypothetical protein